MQTHFSDEQRSDPAIRESEAILRACVHCGFCTATCPTYLLEGDELDSPRGRIYLIKDMLENDRPASPEVVRHVDRCLSCLACMTTCPSGVNYQHLVDHARVHIEKTYRRPLMDRWLRALLACVMPYPSRFRRLLGLARWAKPLAGVLPERLAAAVALVPARQAGERPRGRASSVNATSGHDCTSPGVTTKAQRIGIVTGCVQSVLGRSANDAAVRLLERSGAEIVEISGCCGSLTHHLGQVDATRRFAASMIDGMRRAQAAGSLDAIVVTASGCGTHLKDLGFVLRNDDQLAGNAAELSALTRDVTEIVADIGLPEIREPRKLRVAYHSACSMQHGQRLNAPPRELLRAAGYEVVEIPEGHICCGSAGTYNMLQPHFARRLLERKLANIQRIDVDVIAAGNLGCMTQLSSGARQPVVHTIELLDWATGGPVPPGLESLE